MGSILAPGQRLKLTGAPKWGIGPAQPDAGNRVTVNFEHAGKRTVHIDAAALEPVELPGDEP